MDNPKKLSPLVLLVLTGLFSIQMSVAVPTHDITSYLRQWITEMFDEDLSTNTINSLVKSAFASAKYHRIEEFEHDLTAELEPFQSKFYFHDINFYTHYEDADRTEPFHLSGWNSTYIAVTTKYLRITLEGDLQAEKDKPYASYFTTLHFDDFTLKAIRTSNDSNAPTFSFEISYRKYYSKHHEYGESIHWTSGDLSDDQQSSLAYQLEPQLPTLLREHINRNPKFSTAILGILLVHPGFLSDEHTHYYLIPTIRFFDFNLRNVVVQGFTNIERFDIRDEGDVFSRTLLFRDLRGSLSLDYETEDESPMSLNYTVDFLSISTCLKSDFVHVEARSYCVNRTSDGEPLTYRQSANIIQKIESALISRLFPGKKDWKTIDMEAKIGPMDRENNDWKTIRSLYREWIPFNNDYHS